MDLQPTTLWVLPVLGRCPRLVCGAPLAQGCVNGATCAIPAPTARRIPARGNAPGNEIGGGPALKPPRIGVPDARHAVRP